MKKISILVLVFFFSCISLGFTAPLSREQISDILSIPKGERPAPEAYLSHEYITNHLDKFRGGISFVMTTGSFARYVLWSDMVGRVDGCFVMPKDICDEIEREAQGDLEIWATKLSFSPGYFYGGLVRLDITDFADLRIRIPSGNESGANDLWIPGGYTIGSIPEAVVDQIPKTRITFRFL